MSRLDTSLVRVASCTSENSRLSEETKVSETIVNSVLNSGEPVVISSNEDLERMGDLESKVLGIKSIMAVPIRRESSIIGVIYVDSGVARGLFDDDDFEVFQAMADNVSIALGVSKLARVTIQNIQLENELSIQKEIAEQAKKIEILVDNMKQGLFAITEDEKIQEPVSRVARVLLGEDIDHRSIFETLFASLDRNSESYSRLESAMNTVFGEDEFQWDLVEVDFPKTLDIHSNSGDLINLKITSSPIWDSEGLLEKILFVVEDVTELNRISADLNAQKKKTLLLQEIISSDLNKVKTFLDSVEQKLEKLIIHHTDERTIKGDLHTFKGNARLYKLMSLSSTIHMLETEFIETPPADLSEATKQSLFQVIYDEVELYRDLIEEFFAGESVSQDDLEQYNAVLKRASEILKSVEHGDQNLLKEIDSLLDENLEKSLAKELRGLSVMVEEISNELGKEVNIDISGELMVDKSIRQVLVDVAVHILRNAIDHGIETPDLRESLSKPRSGHIQIVLNDGDEKNLQIIDDGAGIDAEHIGNLAVRKGIIGSEALQSLSERQKLELIFEPEFSSKEKISEISGRGVGMDFVKSSLTKVGGSVEILSSLGKGTTFKLKVPN